MPKNILVVDDDKVRNMHLAVILKRLDYNLFVATRSEDFLRITNSLLPHLVLLDLGMPMVDGQTCLGKLRSDTRLGMIKAVTMSGEMNAGALEESLQKGADAYIIRPVNPTRLYRIIQELTEATPRKVLRLRVVFRVTVRTGTTERRAFATMLSEGGTFVRTMNPLPVGSRLKLFLDLPSTRPIELEGEVIYQVSFNRDLFYEPGMGIRFVDIEKEVREGLRKFVEDHLTSDLDPQMVI